MRSRALLLLLLLAAASALAMSSDPGGSSTTHPCVMGKGASCYKDFTAAGVAATPISACSESKVTFRSDITDDTNNDGVASVYCCPAGVTTVAETCGKPVPYIYSGTEYTTLTGATGRDALYGLVCTNIVVDVTTVESTKTARVQVDCR